MATWVDELAPGRRKLKAHTEGIQFTLEQKIAAVAALGVRNTSASEVAASIGTTRDNLYNWKRQLLGVEAHAIMQDISAGKPPDDLDELERVIKVCLIA